MTSRSLVVLKFGGSVLADGGSIATAVQEVSRHLARHDRAIAVVSAFKAQTDLLEATARALCPRPEPDALAFYTALGELRSAGELTLGLQGAGIAAALRMPWSVGLISAGDPLHATPVSVSRPAFASALDRHPVVVFPGFVGLGEHGEPHVLGRGGSDLTAIFLAAELDADHCVLIKDTPGVFEWDPAREGERPRRYARISWDDAILRCGRMLQPAHVEYARSRSVTIEVKSIGSSTSTIVGPGTTEFEAPREAQQAQRGTPR
jgi:homoserine dehydrogenase